MKQFLLGLAVAGALFFLWAQRNASPLREAPPGGATPSPSLEGEQSQTPTPTAGFPRLSPYLEKHLGAIFAPLNPKSAPLPRDQLLAQRESIRDQALHVSQDDQAPYQTAVSLCDVLLAALDARNNAISSMAHSKAKEMVYRDVRTGEAKTDTKFFLSQIQLRWEKESAQRRMVAEQLYSRLRDQERQGEELVQQENSRPPAIGSAGAPSTSPAGTTERITQGGEFARGAAKRDLKALQPDVQKLIPIADAYATMLEALSRNSRLAITNLVETTTSPETRQTFANNPRAAQEIANKHAERTYEVFQKMVRNLAEVLEDERLASRLSETSASLKRHPDSDLKTILMRIVEDCRLSEEKLYAYRSRNRTDLADMMKQMQAVPGEVDALAANLRSFVAVLKASDAAIEKQ